MPRHLDSYKKVAGVFFLLILVLIGWGAYQSIKINQLRDTVYRRCVQNKIAGDAADEFRRAEVVTFKRLAIDQTVDPIRKRAYEALAEKAQHAVDAYHPEDCEKIK